MAAIFNSGIQIILWLQSLGSWLTPVMKFFTDIGSEPFYLVLAPAILWCVDTSLGMRLIIFLMINAMINTALKIVFHGPRPYWYTSDVKALGSSDDSFGAPSGHAQHAVVVWGVLADRVKRRWEWITAILLMFFIGVSRIYLALHFPHDVLLGWLFGAVLLWLLLHLEKPVISWYNKFNTWMQLLLALLFSLILIAIVLAAQLALGGWSLPVDWVNNAHLAFPSDPVLNPLSYHHFLSSTGILFGITAGWIWSRNYGGFTTKGTWWQLVLRYLTGMVGLAILYLLPSSLLSEAETTISYITAYLRYALIGFWITGIAPWLFIKLKLATKLS